MILNNPLLDNYLIILLKHFLTIIVCFFHLVEEGGSLRVYNISVETEYDELKFLFECYGGIHRLHYSKLRAHVAFVHFKKKPDAAKALLELDFYELKSSQIRVKWIDEEYEEEDNISGRLIRKTLLKSH